MKNIFWMQIQCKYIKAYDNYKNEETKEKGKMFHRMGRGKESRLENVGFEPNPEKCWKR